MKTKTKEQRTINKEQRQEGSTRLQTRKHLSRLPSFTVLCSLFIATCSLLIGSCESPVGGGQSEAELAAASHLEAHAEAHALTIDVVTLNDEAVVDAAIAAYEALPDGVKELLTEAKALLDSLKEKIEELKADATPQELANAFRTGYAAVLALTVETVALSDETAVDAALAAYEKLATDVQALLTTEKHYWII